jgi:hypothetical protein
MISYPLSALGIRIIAPIPGRTLRIEVQDRIDGFYEKRYCSVKFQEAGNGIAITLGKTISNKKHLSWI